MDGSIHSHVHGVLQYLKEIAGELPQAGGCGTSYIVGIPCSVPRHIYHGGTEYFSISPSTLLLSERDI